MNIAREWVRSNDTPGSVTEEVYLSIWLQGSILHYSTPLLIVTLLQFSNRHDYERRYVESLG